MPEVTLHLFPRYGACMLIDKLCNFGEESMNENEFGANSTYLFEVLILSGLKKPSLKCENHSSAGAAA